ncbi:MAG: GDP-mannose 4,6-dehydratase [Candidatus Dojkabacteria bacterium]
MKKALLTGITGQDGSYLTEFLLEKGYEVHGIVRRASNFNTNRIDNIYEDPHSTPKLNLHFGDLSESSVIDKLVREIQPDEVYNLGAMSMVKVSFDIPEYTANVTALGTLRLLEAIRNYAPKAKFYQASSSEMFGKVVETPQKETTPFYPRSPYGVSKLFGYWITVNYRESYGIHASNGILFNHESPRRGKTFVTRKITRGLANIKLGNEECLYLGNLDSMRDWGHANDYIEGMWLMLQEDKGDDYVLATGEMHSVRECCEFAANEIGINIEWKGKGVDEIGIDKATGKEIVKVDPKYFRPAEVELLLGDPTKAKTVLKWKPQYTFESLIREMVRFDLENEKTHKFDY